jgi:hypothetical protein
MKKNKIYLSLDDLNKLYGISPSVLKAIKKKQKKRKNKKLKKNKIDNKNMNNHKSIVSLIDELQLDSYKYKYDGSVTLIDNLKQETYGHFFNSFLQTIIAIEVESLFIENKRNKIILNQLFDQIEILDFPYDIKESTDFDKFKIITLLRVFLILIFVVSITYSIDHCYCYSYFHHYQ